MVRIILVLLLISQFFVCLGRQPLSPPPKPKPVITRILFIFDASYSMEGTWEKQKKINVARSILISMIDSLEKLPNIEMALRVYGHQKPVPPQDCSDSRLEVAFEKGNASAIRQRLRVLEPKGTTPLAASLAASPKDFGNFIDYRNVIILITDGIEACDSDPCFVSRDLQKKGISLKPFIIGIGIDENFTKSFECIGQFYNTVKEEQFKDVLNVVITQALNSTTAQVNLLDEKGKPNEANVNMTFYDFYSGKLKHNYIQTINNKGVPDTIMLDPLVYYRMVVHTIPEVRVDSIKISAGIHNIIAVPAPQGDLIFKGESQVFRTLKVIIRKSGDLTTLNYQEFNRNERYLIGKYDVEIPVLPKQMLYDVEIKQSTTTTLTVPSPGFVTFLMTSAGYGSIYLRENGKDMQWVCNINTANKNETIYLQPGSYTLVYRPLNAKQVMYTVTRNFDVLSNSSKVVELY